MKMTTTELATILESHHKWLANEPSGAYANLTYATIWPGWKIVKK